MPNELDLLRAARQAWADQLHDGAVQWMVGAKMQAEALRRCVENDQPVTPEQCEALVNSLARGLQEARELMRGLEEADPQAVDWPRTIEQDLHAMEQNFPGSQTRMQIQIEPSAAQLPAELAGNAYQLIRESVWNALKHARASSIQVSVRRSEARLIIEITDDGQGFDTDVLPAAAHGVASLQRRADQCGGLARLQSAPGAGTRWQFELPIAPS